jgi:TolB-like protein
MSSIIEGYNYDIFISYRQKDNKHDGWVTEFVDNLKGELESTFKEEISVYFDINPHDGLLETHDVDASLKDKLKCLVFIPIISRTYCDPKSFAWEHEFKAFVEQASQDQLGLKIKLPNGNVTSRVLPIRIHDLDGADIKLCESIIRGVLRGIEFIYKEPGFNRPLKPDDDEKNNLNKTKYRNQITKVALAIKEIYAAIGQFGQHPEEGQKEAIKPISFPLKNNKTKIIVGSVIAFVLITIGILVVPKLLKPVKSVEKSVAVLPFINDSPDLENTYFINGIMDEILNNLQKIKDFKVLSRTSTEQYRGTNKPAIPKIAKELDVNYIVEGSGQKYGNSFRLSVQLIDATSDKHIWGESYEQEIQSTNDIFRIESRVAQSIAKALRANISPEEQHLIEKVPTANLSAYDFCVRGFEELWKFGGGSIDRESVRKAEILFKRALENDSTVALGYVGLAHIYWKKDNYEENYSKNFLDSMLALANIALSIDDQLAEAYFVRGGYFASKGNTQKAKEEYDKAIKVNPNNWQAYQGKGWLSGLDILTQIESLIKAASLNRGQGLNDLLRLIGLKFSLAGFPEKANYYFLEAFKLDGDSIRYLSSLANIEYIQGNYKKSLELLRRIIAMDSTYSSSLATWLAANYMYNGQPDTSLKYLEKWKPHSLTRYDLYAIGCIGYIYWINGYKTEAEHWFDKEVEYCLANIERSDPNGLNPNEHYRFAEIYALKGDKVKAYKNLKIFNQKQGENLEWLTQTKKNPFFNSIRHEPEFQKIIKDMETKYQAEHERVKKWLEARGEL